MARNRGNNVPQQPQGEQNQSENKPDLQVLAQAVTDAAAALETAKSGGDAAVIEAAEKALTDAQASFAAASTPPAPDDEAAASEQAPASGVTAATTEPEAPSTAAPDQVKASEQPEVADAEAPAEAVAEAEADVESFLAHLQQEIADAEKAGNAQLHAWLLSLEGHLGGLKRHFETIHPQATAEIQALARGIKSLF